MGTFYKKCIKGFGLVIDRNLRRVLYLFAGLVIFQTVDVGMALAQSVDEYNQRYGIPTLGQKYLKVEVARERYGQTWLLLGQIRNGKVYIVQADFKEKEYSLQDAPANDSIQKKEAPKKTESAEEKLTKEADLKAPSVNFFLKQSDVKSCEKIKEFETFLSQLEVFQGLFTTMEVTATSRDFSACTTKLTEAIIKKGLQVQVAFHSLPEGGINVRAYLDGRSAPLVVSDDYSDLRLDAYIGTVRRIQAPITRNNLFILSFDQAQVPIRVELTKGKKKMGEFVVEALPQLALGEGLISTMGVESYRVAKGFRDTVSIEEVPQLAVEQAISARNEYQNKYAWSLENQVRARQVDGTGLAKRPINYYVPVSLEANYTINEKFGAKLNLIPQFRLGDDDAPESNYISIGIVRWIVGHENRHYLPPSRWRFGTGLEGFYLDNKGKSATRSSAFLLTNLMGVGWVNRLSYSFKPKWSVEVGVDLMPFPETAVNKSSFSQRQLAKVEYCFNFTNCISGGYRQESFDITYTGATGRLWFDTVDFTVGYRMTIE